MFYHLTAKCWHAIHMFWEDVITHSVCLVPIFILVNHVRNVEFFQNLASVDQISKLRIFSKLTYQWPSFLELM